MRDPRVELVDELVSSLDSVLSLLGDSEAASADGLEETWRQCEGALASLRKHNDALDDRSVGPELASRLDHARRLHSVALSLVSRERDALGERLAGVTNLRKRMKAHDPFETAGESCDMSA